MYQSIVSRRPKEIGQWLFLYIFLFCLGLIISIKQAPFFLPDEGAHFLRAYEVSHGHLINRPGEIGVDMPCHDYVTVAIKYHLIAWAQTKTMLEQSVPACVASTKNTAGAYSFIPYIPAATTMRIAEYFGSTIEQRLIFSRITGFLVWITLIMFSLSQLKHGRLFMGCLVLMPSFFWQLTAVSADGLTLTSCLIYIFSIFNLLQTKKEISLSELTKLLAIAALIGASKGVYAPLCLLSFVLWKQIPIAKPSYKLALLSAPTFVCLIVFAFFVGLADPSLVFLGNGADPTKQFNFIVKHPLIFIEAVYTGIQSLLNIGFVSPSYAVSNEGRGFGITVFTLISCSILAMFSSFTPTRSTRLIAILIAIVLCFSISLPLYLTYNPVANKNIFGLQSRYFLPIIPILYIALAFDATKIDWTRVRKHAVWVAMLPMIGLFLACVNII